MKTIYLGIVCDHSSSMFGLSSVAGKDLNSIIDTYKKESGDDIDIRVSILPFSTTVLPFTEFCTDINKVKPIERYLALGMTALYDGIGDMVAHLSNTPKSSESQYMVMVMTDGEENTSKKWSRSKLRELITDFQSLGNWSFTIRAPYTTSSRQLGHDLNIPQHNIHFWDGKSEESFIHSSVATVRGIGQYISDTKMGVKSTQSFYTDLSKVSSADVQNNMTDISANVNIMVLSQDEVIKPFVEKTFGQFVKGTVYYQLTKPEREVQDYKIILIRDKTTGSVYAGRDARDLLKLPVVGSCKLIPGDHGNFEVFIQSTSINRKLPKGTMVAIWDSMSAVKKPPVKTVPNTTTTGFLTAHKIDPIYEKVVLDTSRKNCKEWEKGFKDGKNHKRQELKSNPVYMKGYEAGRKSK